MRIEIQIRRPPRTLVAYCDESSHTKHRFFVIGASYLIPRNPEELDSVVNTLEKGLDEVKQEFRLSDTLKWTKVPSAGQYQEGYKQFLNAFLEENRWYFRCMVINTQEYPLDDPTFMSSDPLIGYLKFYCTFLADGLMKNKTDYFCDIRIDRYSFRRGNDDATLARAVQGRFMKKSTNIKYDDYCKVTVLDSSEHNLLQLTDLLVGAVAFV